MKFAVRVICLFLVFLLATGGNALALTATVRDSAPVVSAPGEARVEPKTLGVEPAVGRAPTARAAAAFKRFEAAFSGAQGVEWSKDADSPRSVWGFKSGRIEGKAEDVAKAFLGKYQALFGTDGSDLKTEKSIERLGVRHVRLQQMAGGIPVEGAFVAVHMDSAGRVMMVDSTYKTGLTLDVARKVSDRNVPGIVKKSLGKKASPSSIDLVIRPSGKGKGVLAYKVQTRTKNPVGNWTQMIDAGTGEVVSSYNDVRFATAKPEPSGVVEAPPGLRRELVSAPRLDAISAAPENGTSSVALSPDARGARGTGISPRAIQTVTSQGFDGAWPAPYWSVYCLRPNGTEPIAFWGKTNWQSYSGGYSLWPARLGPNGMDPNYYFYPSSLDSWAVYGPFSLANATGVTMNHKLWMQTEPNFDYYSWMAGNGRVFAGFRASGDTGGWLSANTLDMGSEDQMADFGHFLGDSNVYVAIRFKSDSSVVDDGPCVDSFVIQKTVEPGYAGTTSGTYSGYVYPTNGGASRELRPMANQYVIVGPNRATTNVTGAYSTPIAGNVHAWLKGPFAMAENEDYYIQQQNSSSAVWDYAGTNSHADEVNLFYHVNRVHDYFKSIGCGVMDYTMRAWAHVGTEYDNAFYDPGIGFIYFGDGSYAGGDPDGLNDTARGDDVIYHEYTHGVCDHILELPYVLQPGALSEGYADYFAGSFTNDPVMGQWVFPDPADRRDMEQSSHEMRYDNQGIRDSYVDPAPSQDWWALSPGVDPSHNMDSTYNDGGWVHHNSVIVSGMLWDVRNAMMAAYGPTAGAQRADKIILESLFFWPYSLESSVRAMRMSDDLLYGNNNWTNGSPHMVHIDSAAALHGYPGLWTEYLSSRTTVSTRTRNRVRRYMTISGYVNPGVVGPNNGGQNSYGARMTVGLYRYYNRKYRRVTTLYTRLRAFSTSSSKYSLRYTPRARGKWRVVVYFPGSEDYVTGKNVRPSSTARYFTVY